MKALSRLKLESLPAFFRGRLRIQSQCSRYSSASLVDAREWNHPNVLQFLFRAPIASFQGPSDAG